MEISEFKVYHGDFNSPCLGKAKMTGKRVVYKTDPKAYSWFEAREDSWLRDFRAIVYRLCRSTGHYGHMSITQDEDSGIRVERVARKIGRWD